MICPSVLNASQQSPASQPSGPLQQSMYFIRLHLSLKVNIVVTTSSLSTFSLLSRHPLLGMFPKMTSFSPPVLEGMWSFLLSIYYHLLLIPLSQRGYLVPILQLKFNFKVQVFQDSPSFHSWAWYMSHYYILKPHFSLSLSFFLCSYFLTSLGSPTHHSPLSPLSL